MRQHVLGGQETDRANGPAESRHRDWFPNTLFWANIMTCTCLVKKFFQKSNGIKDRRKKYIACASCIALVVSLKTLLAGYLCVATEPQKQGSQSRDSKLD